jgi:hypothetical protein
MLSSRACDRLRGHRDNSANNKYNPDPTATVRWGEQSWEEMFGGPIAVIVDRGIDPKIIMAMPAGCKLPTVPTLFGPVARAGLYLLTNSLQQVTYLLSKYCVRVSE